MRSLNRALSSEARAEASLHLWQQVEALAAFRQAKVVALFSALPDEPDTREVLARWSESKVLLVPRVEGEVMHFFRYDVSKMCDGAFGILEPQQEEVVSPTQIDLMIVPGVAFTSEGDRMGRGKGFYDKYLVQLRPDAIRVGVCYAHQLVEKLPTEPHDVRLDCVVAGKFMR